MGQQRVRRAAAVCATRSVKPHTISICCVALHDALQLRMKETDSRCGGGPPSFCAVVRAFVEIYKAAGRTSGGITLTLC